MVVAQGRGLEGGSLVTAQGLFGADENVLKLTSVIIAQLREYSENQFNCTYRMVHKLCLTGAIKKLIHD